MATGDDDALYARAFHGQLGPVPVEVRQCNENTKGQGVFARRAIEKNEVCGVLHWQPQLVCLRIIVFIELFTIGECIIVFIINC